MYNKQYFKSYYQRSWLGIEKGAKPFLYRFWLRKVKKITKNGDKILEAGCGLGYFLSHLEKERDTIGIDISSDALKIAKESLGIPLLQASAERMPFRKPIFSLIIALDIIEHLSHPEIFFSEAKRILKDGGHIILSTPNPSSFGAKLKGRKPEFQEKPNNERMLEWYGWRDESHINIKQFEEWRNIIKENGFRIVRDGTDTLWDVPYFKCIPEAIQKTFFISAHWVLTWIFGFFPWKWGENYMCIARKIESKKEHENRN